MAVEPNKKVSGAADSDRAKMLRVLIPAGAIALVVILVAVIASLSTGSGRAMSDGSNGSADDPDLKEVSPGVKIRDLKVGDGEPCNAAAEVKVNYTGWLTDGTVFDSSKDRGPIEISLESGVIPGWSLGIPGMKVGGIRKLVIAPDQAYGNRAHNKVPPASTLIFEIELLSTKGGMRPRRSPAPTDLTKLSDGTSPTADDPDLKAINATGLKYRDLKVGEGEVVPEGATVYTDYTGWRLPDGGMFDSSWKTGGRPYPANLVQGVITGWRQGIPGMRVGGIRKLVIPPELGYGAAGGGIDIPPNTTLVFEVEVLGIKPR